jgi:hypothetical protein
MAQPLPLFLVLAQAEEGHDDQTDDINQTIHVPLREGHQF